jgi:hypothetical protein
MLASAANVLASRSLQLLPQSILLCVLARSRPFSGRQPLLLQWLMLPTAVIVAAAVLLLTKVAAAVTALRCSSAARAAGDAEQQLPPPKLSV